MKAKIKSKALFSRAASGFFMANSVRRTALITCVAFSLAFSLLLAVLIAFAAPAAAADSAAPSGGSGNYGGGGDDEACDSSSVCLIAGAAAPALPVSEGEPEILIESPGEEPPVEEEATQYVEKTTLPAKYSDSATFSANAFQNYRNALSAAVPEKLSGTVAKQGSLDIATIRKYHPEVLKAYENLCTKMGVTPYPRSGPGRITSGYRTKQTSGGVSNSPHMYAMAVDVYVGSVSEQLKWVEAANGLFTRAGVYPCSTAAHFDLMPRGFGTPYWTGRNGRYKGAYSFGEMASDARSGCSIG